MPPLQQCYVYVDGRVTGRHFTGKQYPFFYFNLYTAHENNALYVSEMGEPGHRDEVSNIHGCFIAE